MYKQTLCVTLPISAAVIIAGALFANAGDLDPPKGPIEPTMHTLEEIYHLVESTSPCGGCSWEYSFHFVDNGTTLQAIQGTGVLHGVWLKGDPAGAEFIAGIEVWNGQPSDGGTQIANLAMTLHKGTAGRTNRFFQLDVGFDGGIWLVGDDGDESEATLLYRLTTP